MREKMKYFPAEWEQQSGVQLTWPDSQTDWAPVLDEVVPVYSQLAREILKREKLLVVCRSRESLPGFLQEGLPGVTVREMAINDTWARDHGALTTVENGVPVLLNFCFNGWGMKFAACHDNQITVNLVRSGAFAEAVRMRDYSGFVFEGGAIESNGQGCLLTTSACLLSPNRNAHMGREEIDRKLREMFHAEKVIWLDHGFLEGDDTDSHIDTLARFCAPDTIAYVRCNDPSDVHYEELKAMEAELRLAVNQYGESFKLVPLPMADAIADDEGQRLPATYANFLILNNAVLLPVYGVRQDEEAVRILAELFPEREIIPVNSVPLIRQHGSVHCVSMQYPEGIL
jgi:agmatine/peptidylarginine deiminase